MCRIVLVSLASLVGFVAPAAAHYNMLLPDKWDGKTGQPMTFTYQWGHPFEHELFDAPEPESVLVIAPDGTKTDLKKALEKVTVTTGEKGEKKVTAYRFKFTPEKRGDYVFVLRTSPIWMPDENEYWQDTVKVVLHVQTQQGWDHAGQSDFEFRPLTRPYGLQPGMVYQARLMQGEKADLRAFSDKLVEIERYNATEPKSKPSEEQITRTAKTDPQGVVTTTLTDAGWWSLTASRPAGMKEREGKNVPLRQRSTLWVYVDEKPAK
jgi:uncharacterized GH25 family protein